MMMFGYLLMGKLALDIGGGHGAVSGKNNFGGTSRTKTTTVNGVKTADGTENKVTTFDLEGSNTKEHTLTMFYMERGLWESNMKITFNFPKHNSFSRKTVEIPTVDSIFENAMNNLKTKSFDFSISNFSNRWKKNILVLLLILQKKQKHLMNIQIIIQYLQ